MKLYKSALLDSTVDLTLKRIYFWGGIFSQWYKSVIRLQVTDKYYGVFNCAEQAMMFRKAITFGDMESGQRIMDTSNPREQKQIGRSIVGYSDEVWDKVKFEIVAENNYLKFTQNPDLKDLLMTTVGFELVEASPYDTVWGVGLGQDNPLILDRENWQGQNLLGKAIMDAREKILNEL